MQERRIVRNDVSAISFFFHFPRVWPEAIFFAVFRRREWVVPCRFDSIIVICTVTCSILGQRREGKITRCGRIKGEHEISKYLSHAVIATNDDRRWALCNKHSNRIRFIFQFLRFFCRRCVGESIFFLSIEIAQQKEIKKNWEKIAECRRKPATKSTFETMAAAAWETCWRRKKKWHAPPIMTFVVVSTIRCCCRRRKRKKWE